MKCGEWNWKRDPNRLTAASAEFALRKLKDLDERYDDDLQKREGAGA